MKLGFFASVDKYKAGWHGFRNVFNLSPLVKGRTMGPETNCGQYYVDTYGEFEGFQMGSSFSGRHPVEFQSDNKYFLVDATNSDTLANWDDRGTSSPADDLYKLAGTRTFCVSYKHLPTWTCQDGQMTNRGQLVDFGTNQRSYHTSKGGGRAGAGVVRYRRADVLPVQPLPGSRDWILLWLRGGPQ